MMSNCKTQTRLCAAWYQGKRMQLACKMLLTMLPVAVLQCSHFEGAWTSYQVWPQSGGGRRSRRYQTAPAQQNRQGATKFVTCTALMLLLLLLQLPPGTREASHAAHNCVCTAALPRKCVCRLTSPLYLSLFVTCVCPCSPQGQEATCNIMCTPAMALQAYKQPLHSLSAVAVLDSVQDRGLARPCTLQTHQFA